MNTMFVCVPFRRCVGKFLLWGVMVWGAPAWAQTPATSMATPDLQQVAQAAAQRLAQQHKLDATKMLLVISPVRQKLLVLQGNQVQQIYAVSTSRTGLGQRQGSQRTPTGLHRIAQKIGAGAPLGTLFRERQATTLRAPILSDHTEYPEDAVTTRILWLEGLEEGHNRGGRVDSHARYIYIHGTPEEGWLGTPKSHGCVRMGNAAVAALFDNVTEGTLVLILRPEEDAPRPTP